MTRKLFSLSKSAHRRSTPEVAMDIDYVTLIILFITATAAVVAMLCIAHKRIRETVFDIFVISIIFLSGLLISLKSAFKPKREERPPS